MPQQQSQQIDPTVEALVKAIAYTENGGKPNLNKLRAGRTGELASVFQFTPDTWKHDAGEFLGDPSTPITPDAETSLMVKKVGKLLASGKSPEQILSMHNAGSGEPNAWKGTFSSGKPSKGVNKKYNVPYDVPGYVNKGMKYFHEFSGGSQQNQQSSPDREKALATLKTLVDKYGVKNQSQSTPQPPQAATGGLMQQAAQQTQQSSVS